MSRATPILHELVATAERNHFSAHGIHVRLGDDSAAHLWSPDQRRNIHSVAKGVSVIAAGIACAEGIFSLDVPVAEYLPEMTTGEGAEHVTVRHLLGMVSGIDLPWTPTQMTDWPDLAQEFLSRPTRGRTFQYANASTYTAMRALGAVVGDVSAWLQPRLFSPLGILPPRWDRCPNGWVLAGEGLHLRLEELAQLGLLIRDEGAWQGQQLIPQHLVHAMHSDWTEHDAEPLYRRYALSGWAGPQDAWRLHGAYGQLLIFSGDAVVTVLADDHEGADRMAACIVDTLERSAW